MSAREGPACTHPSCNGTQATTTDDEIMRYLNGQKTPANRAERRTAAREARRRGR